MELNSVRDLWNQAKLRSTFRPPKLLYLYNTAGEKFIVIQDHDTIFRVMNRRGQVFMVAHFRCTQKDDHYRCDGPIHIISCTKYDTEEDQYAFDKILPKAF